MQSVSSKQNTLLLIVGFPNDETQRHNAVVARLRHPVVLASGYLADAVRNVAHRLTSTAWYQFISGDSRLLLDVPTSGLT